MKAPWNPYWTPWNPKLTWNPHEPLRSGWWFGTCFFHNIWDVILPIDELLFSRGVGWNHQPEIHKVTNHHGNHLETSPCWLHLGLQVAIESNMPEKDLPGPGTYEPPVPDMGNFHGDFMAFQPRNMWISMAFHQEKWGSHGILPRKMGIEWIFMGIQWNIMGWNRI